MKRGLIVIVLCSCLASEAVATDSDSITVDLDEVQVTGNKTNQNDLTPVSVSKVSSWQLQNLQVADVGDLSALLPNFFAPDYGSRQTSPIIIRGIYSKAKSTAVGFYVDGIPHFESSAFDADMLDVKAVDVLRGPQGTLYGRNTLGGVVNVYTFSPLEYQGTKVKLTGGNYGLFKGQASHFAKFNDNFGLSVSGYYERRNGYFENEFLHKDADGHKAAGGALSLCYKPDPLWTLRFSSALDYVDQGGYAYAPYDAQADTLAAVAYNRECGYNRLISTSGLTVNYKGDKFSLNSQTSFQLITDKQSLDQDFTPNDVYFVKNEIDNTVVSEELTLKSEGDGRFQWISGLFLFNQTGSQLQGTDYITKGYRQEADYQQPARGAALFAQTAYNFWKRMSATLGLRLDYEYAEMDYVRNQYGYDGVNKPVSNFISTTDHFQLLPKVGLLYKLDNFNQLFGSVTRGYKGGGFNANFSNNAERVYGPEYNWNYEVGVKCASSNYKFKGELTLFYIDWRNQHVSRVVSGMGTVVSNAGHSTSKGVELSAAVIPVTGMSVVANYGYTYAKFAEYKKSETADYSGNFIPLVPSHTLSLNACYRIHPKHLFDAVTPSLGVVGVGKLYWLDDNVVEQPFYLTPKARVELQKGLLSLSLWGKNLSSTDYLNYYFVSSVGYAQKGTPLTFGADLLLKF